MKILNLLTLMENFNKPTNLLTEMSEEQYDKMEQIISQDVSPLNLNFARRYHVIHDRLVHGNRTHIKPEEIIAVTRAGFRHPKVLHYMQEYEKRGEELGIDLIYTGSYLVLSYAINYQKGGPPFELVLKTAMHNRNWQTDDGRYRYNKKIRIHKI